MAKQQTAAGRAQTHRRRRRRKKSSPALLIFVFFVLAAAGAAISVGTYFKVQNLVVKGCDTYSVAQIAKASDISVRQNLFRIDTRKVAESLCEKLPYIKTADVVIKPLSTVIINVTEDTPEAAVKNGNRYVVVDGDMKVLELTDKKLKGYPVVTGLSVKSCEPGKELETGGASARACLGVIFGALKKNGISVSLITAVDVSDTYDLTVDYDGRIEIHAGNSAYMNYKLKMAKYIISKQLSAASRGRLDVSNAQPDSEKSGKMFFDPE